ncbi:hypothetical protein ACUOAQ_29120, partial [Escherichia sp. SP-MK]
MTEQELFEEKQHVVIAAIKQQFGSIARARQIAKMNNMGRAYSEEFLLVSTKVLTRKSVMSKIKKRIKNFQKI